MTTDEKLDALTDRLDTLTGVVETLTGSIGVLLQVATKHQEAITSLTEQGARTEREWQAYLTRLPKN